MKKNFLLLLAIPAALCAQTTINGSRIIKGSLDASGSTRSLPNRTGTGSPAGRDTCANPGETYFQTDATAGQNLWVCTAAGTPGTWNQISGSGGSNGESVVTGTTSPSGSCSAGSLYLRTDIQELYVCSGTNVWELASYASGNTESRPIGCVSGQLYVATDTGDLWYCAVAGSLGTWQSVTPLTNVSLNGTSQGAFSALNLVNVPGANWTVTPNGQTLSISPTPDTTYLLSQAAAQNGAPFLCAPASNNSSAYSCSLTPTPAALSNGMLVEFRPDVSCAGGSTTLNINGLGAKPIYSVDGSSNPAANDCRANRPTWLAYSTALNSGAGAFVLQSTANLPALPNTPPSGGQIPVGNSGGTAYVPEAVTGDATLASTGALTVSTATNLRNGSAGAIPYQSAAGATAMLAGNTAATDQAIVSHGTGSTAQAPTLSNAPALSAANMTNFPTLNQNTTGNAATATSATTATNLAGGTVGAIAYQSSAGTTSLLGGNTSAQDQVLTSTGTGSAAQAPTLKNAPALSMTNMSGLTAGQVPGVNGVTITGTPSTGQVPVATSSTTATWQTPASGGGNASVNQGNLGTVAATTATFTRTSNVMEYTLTLGNNITSSLSGWQAWDVATFHICQNSSTAYTFAWPSNYNFGQAPAIPTDLGVCVNVVGYLDNESPTPVFQLLGAPTTTELPFLISAAQERSQPTNNPVRGNEDLWPDSSRYTWAGISYNPNVSGYATHIMPRTSHTSNDQLYTNDLADQTSVLRISGSPTAGDCLDIASVSSGVVTAGDAGAPCGSGGGSGANANAFYLVTQSANEPANAVNLGALSSGVLAQTVSGGVATIGIATSSSTFPGNSATASALAATPSQCPGGQFATGVTAAGTANCATPGGAMASGTVTYTSSHALGAADNGLLVQMNCSAACTVTLPNPQPSSTFATRIVSINTTNVPTVVLGSSMTWFGQTAVPVLNAFRPLLVQADSNVGTNYAGDAPIVAGSNVTLTPSANGLTIAASGSGGGTPGGSSGQIQYNNGGSFGGFTVGGDATLNVSTGALTVTKTNGTAFATSATTDTTNASNINSGTLAAGRLPSTVVQINQNNTYTAGTQNASGAAHTLPAVVGSVAPSGSCTAGELYFNTAATAGQNLYFCTSTNTWTQMSGGGGSSTITETVYIPFGAQYSTNNNSQSEPTGGGVGRDTGNASGSTPYLAGGSGYAYPGFMFPETTTQANYIYATWMLPSNWTGTLNVTLLGLAGSVTGNAALQVATSCPGSGAAQPPTYNTASLSTMPLATADRMGTLTLSGVNVTGCSSNSPIVIQIGRNAQTGNGDTLSGNMYLLGMQLQWQHN